MCCLHTALLNIYFECICNVDAVKLSIFAVRKGLVPTTAQALDQALGWGGWCEEAVPISDFNFDKYLCCLSLVNIIYLLYWHFTWSMYISPKMHHRKCFIQMGHLGLHILYKHFCVLSFHSVLCFPNDYHIWFRKKNEKYVI